MRRQDKPSHTSPASGAASPEPARVSPRALVAGLEILEYLSRYPDPVAPAALAAALNMTLPAVQRAIAVLEERGYITHIQTAGSYARTDRLYQLQPATSVQPRLVARAQPIMQSLSTLISQSCNLAIPSLPDMQVVAREDSPGPFGINVPLGFRYDIPASAAGLTFAAFTRNSDPARWLEGEASVVEAHQWSSLKKAVQRAAECGFVQLENTYLPDVVDLSCPVFDGGHFVAALTVPYIKTAGSANLTWSLAALQTAAEQLTLSLRGDALVA